MIRDFIAYTVHFASQLLVLILAYHTLSLSLSFSPLNTFIRYLSLSVGLSLILTYLHSHQVPPSIPNLPSFRYVKAEVARKLDKTMVQTILENYPSRFHFILISFSFSLASYISRHIHASKKWLKAPKKRFSTPVSVSPTWKWFP